MKVWLDKARYYSKTFLGIMTLFVILDCAYMLGAVAFGGVIGAQNQFLLILFSILFPFVLLGGVLWMIAKYPIQTIDAKNFKNEETYLKVLRMAISINKKYKMNRESPKTEKERREDVEESVNSAMSYIKSDIKEERYILWVDDNPINNIYERIALEQLGCHFVLASSTNEALSQVSKINYVLIISDMKRHGESDAGYLLLKQLKGQGTDIPYIIYTDYCTPECQKEAIRNGAVGLTNTPEELIALVVKAMSL